MLRALSVARKPHIAFDAVLRQRVCLGLAELHLLRKPGQPGQWLLQNVPQLVIRIDEMVARIRSPLCSITNAEPHVFAIRTGSGSFPSTIQAPHRTGFTKTRHVRAHPLVKIVCRKIPYCSGSTDHSETVVCVGAYGFSSRSPLLSGSAAISSTIGMKLKVPAADRLQKFINLQRLVRGLAIDDRERVELNLMPLQHFKPAHHLGVCWLAALSTR